MKHLAIGILLIHALFVIVMLVPLVEDPNTIYCITTPCIQPVMTIYDYISQGNGVFHFVPHTHEPDFLHDGDFQIPDCMIEAC
jgi:hypothetical protein